MSDYDYVGTELDLFADARRWKCYLRRVIAPYLGPEVLEVGAGIGATTAALYNGAARRLDLPGARRPSSHTAARGDRHGDVAILL